MCDSQTFNNSKITLGKYAHIPICENIREYYDERKLANNNFTDEKLANIINEIYRTKTGKNKYDGNGKEIKIVERSTVTNWRNGKQKPNQNVWEYIANAMEINVVELLEKDGYKKSKEKNQQVKDSQQQIQKLSEENARLRMKSFISRLDEIELKHLRNKYYHRNCKLPKLDSILINENLQQQKLEKSKLAFDSLTKKFKDEYNIDNQ